MRVTDYIQPSVVATVKISSFSLFIYRSLEKSEKLSCDYSCVDVLTVLSSQQPVEGIINKLDRDMNLLPALLSVLFLELALSGEASTPKTTIRVLLLDIIFVK